MYELSEETVSVYGQNNKKEEEDAIITQALSILEKRMKHRTQRTNVSSALDIAQYYRLHLGQDSHETFIVLALDSKYRVIKSICEFAGKENACSIYQRRILRSALQLNECVALVCLHNHPSGTTEPSAVDIQMTKFLNAGCDNVDLLLLDHIIVTFSGYYSFADEGML